MSKSREVAYGQRGLSRVDRLGVWLSRRAIERRIGPARDLVAADLGCGYHATLLVGLRPLLREGVGIDVKIADEVRDFAPLRFVESPLERALPGLPDLHFDLVLFINTLEHLDEPQAALGHVHRMLKPGGRLFLNVPTWWGKTFLELSAFRLGLSAPCEVDDHRMYYDKRDLWPLLVRAGFRPRRLELRYHKLGLNLFAVAQR